MHLTLLAFVALWLLLWAIFLVFKFIERLEDDKRHPFALLDGSAVVRSLSPRR